MEKVQLDYFISIGLKTFAEVLMFRTLRTEYDEKESLKIIAMQRD